MADLTVKALDASTWADFAGLVERNNGVWGGCWCMGFHPEGVGRDKTVEQNRSDGDARALATPGTAVRVAWDRRFDQVLPPTRPPDETPDQATDRPTDAVPTNAGPHEGEA